MEGYVQGALLKELHIPSFVERFKEALGIHYLNIAFLLNFFWREVIYRVLYERSYAVLLL